MSQVDNTKITPIPAAKISEITYPNVEFRENVISRWLDIHDDFKVKVNALVEELGGPDKAKISFAENSDKPIHERLFIEMT